MRNHWIFKYPMDRYYDELTPFQQAYWGMWRSPSYSKEEVLEINQNILNWQANQTKELSLLAVKRDINNIFHVKEEFFSKELADEVVSKSGYYIKYVPEDFQTSFLKEKAIRSYPDAIVDIKNVTFANVRYACFLSKNLLKYMPKEKQTLEICIYSILYDSLLWEDVKIVSGNSFEEVLENLYELKKIKELAGKLYEKL